MSRCDLVLNFSHPDVNPELGNRDFYPRITRIFAEKNIRQDNRINRISYLKFQISEEENRQDLQDEQDLRFPKKRVVAVKGVGYEVLVG